MGGPTLALTLRQFAAARVDPDQPIVAGSAHHQDKRGDDADLMSDHSYGRPMVDRVIRHAELMDRMMERLGVDAAAAARVEMGMAFHKARTRCIGCCRERQCRDWLARSESGAPREPPQFCSDGEFFRRLRPRVRRVSAQ
jgi:hypothetical protein